MIILVSAIGLMLVFEGILPFLSPEAWRKLMRTLGEQSDRNIRLMGLISMLVGLGIITLFHFT